MGRPLKIKQSTTVDIGFNDFGNLTAAVIPTGITSTEFLGVVGGANVGIATADYPVVKITANINGVEGAAYIITQKGTTKYLVTDASSVSAGSFTIGYSYRILSVGDTDWTAIGGPAVPVVGTVFTATGVGSGTGTATAVAQCNLVAGGTINSGEMNMVFNADGSSIYASRLTNKYIWDNTAAPTGPVRYAVNFFVAGETTAVTLGSVAVANTAGWFTANASTFTTGQIINVSGTLTGNATITGYVDPTVYYVVDTNGTTTFQLAASEGAANIVTAAGNTRGLTFSEETSTTAKSGAEVSTWTNTTGLLTLGDVQNYTS
jgi:hypothetical protein